MSGRLIIRCINIFSFTVYGLIFFGGGEGGHRQLFMVIIIEVNFPPVCFITSFYKRIFLNNYRLPNGCSSAFTVKEGLWILLKTLAAAFPFNKLICHDAPIVIKLLRDIKGILNLTS